MRRARSDSLEQAHDVAGVVDTRCEPRREPLQQAHRAVFVNEGAVLRIPDDHSAAVDRVTDRVGLIRVAGLSLPESRSGESGHQVRDLEAVSGRATDFDAEGGE